MEIDFIPEEWNDAEKLPFVMELVVSMNFAPEQRGEILRLWGEWAGVAVEVEEIGGEE